MFGEVKRSVKQHKNEEITIIDTGHDMGAAVATKDMISMELTRDFKSLYFYLQVQGCEMKLQEDHLQKRKTSVENLRWPKPYIVPTRLLSTHMLVSDYSLTLGNHTIDKKS